jgi:hypothetical protein
MSYMSICHMQIITIINAKKHPPPQRRTLPTNTNRCLYNFVIVNSKCIHFKKHYLVKKTCRIYAVYLYSILFLITSFQKVYKFQISQHTHSVSIIDIGGCVFEDRLCGLVVRVLGYRSGGPGSIPGTTRKKRVVGLERVHSAS